MLGGSQVAAQPAASRAVLSSLELEFTVVDRNYFFEHYSARKGYSSLYFFTKHEKYATDRNGAHLYGVWTVFHTTQICFKN
jgi:hypothetical protein